MQGESKRESAGEVENRLRSTAKRAAAAEEQAEEAEAPTLGGAEVNERS